MGSCPRGKDERRLVVSDEADVRVCVDSRTTAAMTAAALVVDRNQRPRRAGAEKVVGWQDDGR